MKQKMGKNIAKSLQQATLLIVGSALAVSAAYGQGGGPGAPGGNSGQCSVTQIRLRIVTGGDDLRGGKDNLNIQILFAGGRAPQVALNVNKSQNWPNNSTNTVNIRLNQPVPPNQIIGLRLIHIADGGFNFNSLPSVLTPAAPWEIPQAFLSPDNWDMSLLQVAAIGNGVGARIAGHGFNRFTGSNPVLTVATHVPANACGSGRPSGNSGGGSGDTGPTSFQPLIPRSGSNTGSGGALLNLQPLIPRGSANTGSGSGTGAQQAQKPLTIAPQPVPNVSPLGTPRPASAPRQPGQGVVEGYVYWDASVLKHSPTNGCVGLSVTVSRGGIPLVTMTDNFAYMGNVGSDAVCRYAVKGLPVDENLQVQANVTLPAAFSPVVLPSGGSKSITLTTGAPTCAPGGPLNPSPSDLSSGWSSCADIASNVNFMLVPARPLAPLSARMRSVGPGGSKVELSPQPYPPKSKKNGPEETLLPSGAQQTLLGAQANSPSSNGNKSALIPAVQSPAATGGTKQGTTAMSPTAVERNGSLGDGSVRPAPVGTVGPSQTMSAQGNVGSPVGRQGITVPLAPATMSQLNRPNKMRMAAGTVTGAIFWDANRVAYNPSVPCQGLQVALSVITGTGTQPLGTTNQFQFTQSARQGPGNQLCSYSFDRVPEGVALQVQVSIGQPFASQVAVVGPFGATNSPIKIPGGECNNSPSGTALALESGWQSCGERAYDVNFQLIPRRAAATLLGDGSVRTAPGVGTVGPSQTMSAQGNASSNAGPAPVPSKGHGKTQYDAMTLDRGVTSDKSFSTWANSTQAAGKGSPSTPETESAVNAGGTGVSTVSAPRTVSSLAAMGQVPSQVNLQVASACAKDPSFRILFVSGTSDGKTLTVGPQYTVWGCSFGNMPAAKRPTPPVVSPSQSQTASYPSYYNVAVWTSQPFFEIDAHIASWSDNAIVVSFPPRPANHPGPSTAGLVLPAQVLVTRGDGQTRIYPSNSDEGPLMFIPAN